MFPNRVSFPSPRLLVPEHDMGAEEEGEDTKMMVEWSGTEWRAGLHEQVSWRMVDIPR
jgi:hypothetical protein